MKVKQLIPATLFAVLIIGAPIFGQYANLSLDLKVTLYASDEGRKGLYSPDSPGADDAGIVFAKWGHGDDLTESKLGKLFNLNKVRTAGEAEMNVRWPGDEIPNSRIAHALRVNGRDFLLVLFPDRVGFKDNVYMFKAEIYELDPKADAGAKRICADTIDLRAFGFLGFFFKDKTYFLTVHLLRSGWGASIPRPPVLLGPTSEKKYP